jgi:hypothetical protein
MDGYTLETEMLVTRQDAVGGPTVQTIIMEQDFDREGNAVGEPREHIGEEVRVGG